MPSKIINDKIRHFNYPVIMEWRHGSNPSMSVSRRLNVFRRVSYSALSVKLATRPVWIRTILPLLPVHLTGETSPEVGRVFGYLERVGSTVEGGVVGEEDFSTSFRFNTFYWLNGCGLSGLRKHLDFWKLGSLRHGTKNQQKISIFWR